MGGAGGRVVMGAPVTQSARIEAGRRRLPCAPACTTHVHTHAHTHRRAPAHAPAAQVLLFPAMRPDESDATVGAMSRASRSLAASIRAEENRGRGEVAVAAGGSHAAAAPPLPADLAAINARLVASGKNFLGGVAPAKEDAACFERVNAAVVGATLSIDAAAAPGLSRWYDLVSLFAPATRATWA